MIVNRPTLGRLWAVNGMRFDPGAAKYSIGWTAEIPTYEVLNYLQYRIDLALLSSAQRGIPEWGSDIGYKIGSVVWDDTNNTVYVSKVDEPDRLKKPSENSLEWAVSSIQLTLQRFSDLEQQVDDHIDARNDPHNVTAEQVGTYTKTVIDNKITNVSQVISSHINRVDNPHSVTAAQVGAVPITGGTYLGEVTFNAVETKINPGAGDQAIYADASEAGIRIGDAYLAIDRTSGRAFNKVSGVKSFLLNEEEYVEARREVEPEYAVPSPDFEMDLLSDIHIRQGFGYSELIRNSNQSYTDKSGTVVNAAPGIPRQESQGLRLESTFNEYLKVDAPLNWGNSESKTVFFEGSLGATSGDVFPFDLLVPVEDKTRFSVLAANGQVQYEYVNQAGTQVVLPLGNVAVGEAFKVTIVHTASETIGYFNGVATVTGPAKRATPAFATIAVGRSVTSPGVMHARKFMIWQQALTAQQISTL